MQGPRENTNIQINNLLKCTWEIRVHRVQVSYSGVPERVLVRHPGAVVADVVANNQSRGGGIRRSLEMKINLKHLQFYTFLKKKQIITNGMRSALSQTCPDRLLSRSLCKKTYSKVQFSHKNQQKIKKSHLSTSLRATQPYHLPSCDSAVAMTGSGPSLTHTSTSKESQPPGGWETHVGRSPV